MNIPSLLRLTPHAAIYVPADAGAPAPTGTSLVYAPRIQSSAIVRR